MRSNNYEQYQYRQNPYICPAYCRDCPVMQDYYGYWSPAYDDFYRTAEEEDLAFNTYDEINSPDRNYKLTNEHIEKVVAMIKQDSMNIIFKDIQKFITDNKILEFLLVALVTYIINNYYKYSDVIDEKTDELVADMKKNLPWVFDILRIFNITPEMVDDFLDNLIKATVLNLRKLVPMAL